jgi:hypothetical protein
MDYNGFIRLIQFFDNALFKMMEDFIPARTNLSTGITINSPVLERNKVSYAKPLINNQEIFDAEYNGPTITSQYGNLYNNLSGDKSPFYTGELSGSEIDIYNSYFVPNNFNPYLLGDTGSYNSQNSIEDSLSLNRFNHSEYNVLLNNVSSSLTSRSRRLYEPVYGTTASVLSPVQLQDSYLSLKSYQTSRYEGSKLISLEYNTYTSSSYTSSDGFTLLYGDKSYGKTAAIDHYVRKIGLFTQIESSSFLPLRNNVAIKYLVDEFGNLTELNQQNKHWEEIQNTFKANNTLNISLFDNKKFTNQKLTEGDKDIFDSGYSYYPILYATGSPCSTVDNILNFENLDNPTAYFAKVNNDIFPYRINGYQNLLTDNDYPLIPSGSFQVVERLFNNVIEGNDYFEGGGTTINSFPSYSIQEAGNYNINVSLDFYISINSDTTNSAIWALQAWKSGSAGSELITESRQEFYTNIQLYNITLAYIVYVEPSNPTDVCDSLLGRIVSNFFITTPTIGPGTYVYINETRTPLQNARFIVVAADGEIIYNINSSTGLIGASTLSMC